MLDTKNSNSKMLSHKEKISYGYGDTASNFVWGMVNSFALYFYTDVFGLTAASVATMFLIMRIFDALNDPAMGILVDKTKSKHGKTRPYLLYLALPFGILSILTFITPEISYNYKLLYAYITYGLLGVIYTAINIPYGALIPLMTRDSNEKGELNSYRAIGRSVGTIIVASATLPLVHLVGQGNEKVGFPIVMTIYSIIGIILFGLTFKYCHERVFEIKEERDTSLKKSFIQMFKNKYWLLVSANSFMWFVRMGIMNGILIYYVNYVLLTPNLTPVYLTVLNIANLFGGFIALLVLKRYSSRNSSILMLTIATILLLSLFVIESHSITIFLIIFFIANLLIGYSDPATLTMLGDTLDYQEWKFGNRPEGLLVSSYSFSTKFGVAIGSSLIGYALSWVGYTPNNVTENAKNLIRFLMLGLPIALTIFQIIILYFYKLDKYHETITKIIKQRGQ